MVYLRFCGCALRKRNAQGLVRNQRRRRAKISGATLAHTERKVPTPEGVILGCQNLHPFLIHFTPA